MNSQEAEKFASEKSNDELLAILAHPSEWPPTVIDAAKTQLQQRGVPYGDAVPASYQGAAATRPATGLFHQLTDFPVVAAVLLHYCTCGIFTLIWLNLLHGKLPKVRPDDPSAGRAVGFCFIPFFNLYWIFFTYRRLCLRIDEQRQLYGLPSSNLTGMATTNCIFQVIPYINGIFGYTLISPIFIGLMQSSVNQLVRQTAVSPPRATPAAFAPASEMPVWAIVLLACSPICLIAVLAGLLLPALAKARQKAQRINCAIHLKQVGLAFRIWDGDHAGQFPFNVSTNQGGTRELCLTGPDGLDQNSWLHFQVMSNELTTPNILLCPNDITKQAATDFSHLRALNVTYVIHSGTNVSDVNPQAVLAICPIHHNALFADGSVQQLTEAQMQKLMSEMHR